MLRIQVWSEAPSLPNSDALIEGFKSRSGALAIQVVDAKNEPDHALAVLAVTPSIDGGASTSKWLTVLGAKKLGSDVFLCSSAPGSSEDEVKAAAAACGALSRGSQ